MKMLGQRGNGSTRYCRFWLSLVGSLLLTTACSVPQFGYSIAPTLARWQLDDFVDFDARQQKILDARLAEIHAWHRQTQLPAYINFLNDAQHRLVPAKRAKTESASLSTAMAAGAVGLVMPLSVDELSVWRDRVSAAFVAGLQRLAEPVAEIAVTLTPGQLLSIQAELDRRNVKARADYLPGADRRSVQARFERWQERLEANIGPLSEKQQALLAARVRALPTSSNWWQNRLDRQQRTMAVLRDLAANRPPLQEATARVQTLFAAYGTPVNEAAAAAQAESSRASQAMLIEVLAIATPAQYRFARERFAGFTSDLGGIVGSRDSAE